ncbi:hypothetical protein ACP70R_003664 [Stipagrostis hirtigluma subsp. patula]
MSLVYRREGLRAPVVLQEFVNHGGVLFKVYVVGDRAACVTRRSLPDVPHGRLHTGDPCAQFANISHLPPHGHGAAENSVMPPADFVDEVAHELRRALGLHLFNFDMIRAKEHASKYLIIDINYCPVYSKMPGFEYALIDFFSHMLRRTRAP